MFKYAASVSERIAVYPYVLLPFAKLTVVGVIIALWPPTVKVIAEGCTDNTGILATFLGKVTSLYFITCVSSGTASTKGKASMAWP